MSLYSANYFEPGERGIIGWDGPPSDEMLGLLRKAWPELYARAQCPRCPVEGYEPMSAGPRAVIAVISHLVDYHDMPRDDIADWLDSL